MKAKNIINTLLLVFVGFSVAYMVFDKQKSSDVIPPDDIQQVHKDAIVVYYFYGDKRCVTCKKLEGYAKEALTAYFSQQLTSGEVVWRSLNIDLPENNNFVKDYELVTKSVVLSKVKDGKEVNWQNLDKIWDKVRDKDDYLSYIKENVTEILKDQG
jgi:thioredoxin-related protein